MWLVVARLYDDILLGVWAGASQGGGYLDDWHEENDASWLMLLDGEPAFVTGTTKNKADQILLSS